MFFNPLHPIPCSPHPLDSRLFLFSPHIKRTLHRTYLPHIKRNTAPHSPTHPGGREEVIKEGLGEGATADKGFGGVWV